MKQDTSLRCRFIDVYMPRFVMPAIVEIPGQAQWPWLRADTSSMSFNHTGTGRH